MANTRDYLPKERIVLVVGNYGSGKTEVSVNLAIHLSRNHDVAIADLDIVNPYFRCREARDEMESHGIRVINPAGGYQTADLPIILPEIKGTIQTGEKFVIFDVGGDDVGARVLSSLADIFEGQTYSMLQVINARRPFTDTVEGCLKIKSEIEAASRLCINGLVSNTHLLDETDLETIREGCALARRVGDEAGLPLEFVTVDETVVADGPTPDIFEGGRECAILRLRRRMLPPWKLKRMTDRADRVLKRDP